jgi:hypothetical protein
LSSISFAFHYYNTFASNAIALLVIPAFIVVGRILHKVERTLELRLAFACKFLTWLLSCQINKRCFVIGVTRMVTQLPHFPIGHSLDSPGVMVPDEANLGYGYLFSLNVRSRGVIDIDQDANAFPIAVLTLWVRIPRG